MNNKSIFDYEDYKAYLRDFFAQKSIGHGFKSQFAKGIQCQNSFVSQVLTGKAELSIDQAFRATQVLSHSQEEADFFQLLVSLHRATDREFKVNLKQKIKFIRSQRAEIKNRVSATKDVPIEAKAQYYSSWVYIAIHMAASLKPSMSPSDLANYFSLPLARTQDTIQFLVTHGLVKLESGAVTMGPAHLHLPSDSVLVRTHHLNWRTKAMQNLDVPTENNLHYSVVYSVSKEDAAKLKNKILEMIQDNLKVVSPSKEEILIANTIDFFEVGNHQNS